jgi:hypothetical protein
MEGEKAPKEFVFRVIYGSIKERREEEENPWKVDHPSA